MVQCLLSDVEIAGLNPLPTTPLTAVDFRKAGKKYLLCDSNAKDSVIPV